MFSQNSKRKRISELVNLFADTASKDEQNWSNSAGPLSNQDRMATPPEVVGTIVIVMVGYGSIGWVTSRKPFPAKSHVGVVAAAVRMAGMRLNVMT